MDVLLGPADDFGRFVFGKNVEFGDWGEDEATVEETKITVYVYVDAF